MRILIDECVPHIVKKRLPKHAIFTVQEMSWSGIKNGQLLSLASAQFDVFITSDKNLRHQQDLASLDLAIILLPGNQVPLIESVLPRLDEVLSSVTVPKFTEL